MANGNQIFTAGEPRGVHVNGIIVGTPSPGMAILMKPATALANGQPSYQVTGRDFDGQPDMLCILDGDWEQGKLATSAYITGTPFRGYVPLVGERCNLLVKASSGAVTIGEKFMVEASSGLFIPYPAQNAVYETGEGDAESELIAALNLIRRVAVAKALEAIADPSGNALVWMEIISNG